MAVYLVDYENVNKHGLVGIESLHPNDKVVIFYSFEGSVLPVYMVDECRAKLEFRKVYSGTKNALDFQLVAYLFHEMQPEEDYFIISEDNGYDILIPMAFSYGNIIARKSFIGEDEDIWINSEAGRRIRSKMILLKKKTINEKIRNVRGIYGIGDFESIGNPDKEDIRLVYMDTDLQQTIIGMIEEKTGCTPTKEMVQMLIKGLDICDNRNEFYQFCRNNLGEKTGHGFYTRIKNSFEKMVEAVMEAS